MTKGEVGVAAFHSFLAAAQSLAVEAAAASAAAPSDFAIAASLPSSSGAGGAPMAGKDPSSQNTGEGSEAKMMEAALAAMKKKADEARETREAAEEKLFSAQAKIEEVKADNAGYDAALQAWVDANNGVLDKGRARNAAQARLATTLHELEEAGTSLTDRLNRAGVRAGFAGGAGGHGVAPGEASGSFSA